MGTHLLADLYGASNLTDTAYIQASCEDAAVATGATIIMSNFHHFGEGNGVSGIVLLAESHLSIHTWPEHGIATLDVYVCGGCDPTLALPVFEERFRPSEMKTSLHRRGNMI
jgi:S-adenosylmethionine decarboxylase